jgi:hypothetical protein
MLGCMLVACSGGDEPTGSGTGGDEEMPDGSDPGPGGPGCEERIAVPSGMAAEDLTAASQPAVVARVVVLRDDPKLAEDPVASQAGSPVSLPLAARSQGVGATTGGPHVHERWGESRKLELSYCITGMPGEDAEIEAAYHKTIRALSSTMAEWERVSGVNFVHVAEDDTPGTDTYVMMQGNDYIARADCVAGTKAYFGVVSLDTQQREGVTNAVPQAWNDPALEPVAGNLARTILLNKGLIEGFGDDTLLSLLRHELGHMMGFEHEEVNVPDQACHDSEARPLTPVDTRSIMTTPSCRDVLSDDADHLTPRDRLSAFFLHHTPRARFETGGVALGYRYAGVLGEGAEILWHSEGSTEGILWRPQVDPDGISFTGEAFEYSSAVPPPAGGWFPSESEVVVPLQLATGPTTFDLVFFGPGPDVAELVVFNSGLSTTAVPWEDDSFSVPVVGRFDAEHLDRDVVYLYRPGDEVDAALVAVSGEPTVTTGVEQQSAYAYPLAAPYRGNGFPDDVVWLEPRAGHVLAWRLADAGVLDVEEVTRMRQGQLGLVPGEHIPAIGDFDGDGRADIMWHGVSNLPAGFQDIEDVLWLSRSTATELSFAVLPKSVGFGYRPLVGDFDGDGIHDVFWQRSWGLTAAGPLEWSTEPSFLWYFDGMGGHEAEAFAVGGDYSPYVGDFDADGCHDIAWFDAVGDQLHLWRCIPGMRDFDCGAAMPTPPDSAPVGMHWGF